MKHGTMHRLLAWTPISFWAALIFYLSSIPSLNSGLGVWDLILRKLAHVIEYGIFTGLFYYAVRTTWTAASRTNLIKVSALAAIGYAISDEFHQGFVPGRGPSVGDVLIDSIGVAICAIYLLWILGRQQRSL